MFFCILAFTKDSMDPLVVLCLQIGKGWKTMSLILEIHHSSPELFE